MSQQDLATAPEEVREATLTGVIAMLLVVGVGFSASVLLLGLVLLLVTGQTGYNLPLSVDLVHSVQGATQFPTTLSGVYRGVRQLRPFAIIELGILLLIATPVFRVAASVVLFLAEADRLYAAITVVVLALLMISIFGIG